VLFGSPGIVLVLRVKDHAAFTSMMPQFHSELYRKLEVSIIDHVVLEKLLALSTRWTRSTSATPTTAGCGESRPAGEYQLVFLLTPIGAKMIKAVADLGEKMPKKSTYFLARFRPVFCCTGRIGLAPPAGRPATAGSLRRTTPEFPAADYSFDEFDRCAHSGIGSISRCRFRECLRSRASHSASPLGLPARCM